jgi:hypothetical protein
MRSAAILALLALAAAPAAAQFLITTNAVPNASLGQPYGAVTIATVNGTPPISWSFVAGQTPPPGFVVGSSSTDPSSGTFCYGVLSSSGQPICTGAVQGFAGTYVFTIRAVDLAGNVDTHQYTFALQEQLFIVTPQLEDAVVSQVYTVQLAAAGGTGAYRWSVISGDLPPGIGLSQTGLLSGVAPNTSGSFPFVVRVEDLVTGATASRQFVLNVVGGLRILTTTLPLLTVNEPMTPFQFAAVGGSSYVWSVVNSVLPQGLTLSAGGVLSGAVSSTGAYQFFVQVTDPTQSLSAQRLFTLYVTRGPLRIVQSELPVGALNTPYSAALTAEGGLPPFTWTFGTLATQGLRIDPFSGVITGTPAATGSFPLPVTLTDATGTRVTREFTLFVVEPVSITTASFPNATLGVPYLQVLRAAGGQPPYRWAIAAGDLPPGLILDAVLGRIQGTPAAEGAYQFTLRVTDFGQRTATRQLALVVGAGVSIVTTSLPDAITGQGYSFALQTAGGVAPLNWSIASGSLPAGLALNASTGVIAGTAAAAGSATITVRVLDAAANSAERTFTLHVAPPLLITTGALPNGGRGAAYSQPISATGGRAPYRWSIASGAQPPGLQLNASTGVLSGTPSASGTYGFTVEVADAGSQTARAAFSIVIGDPLSIVTGDLMATFNQAFSRALQASGGFAPYTWSMTGGSLPQGLTFNAAAATISGTPAAAGTFRATFQVRDQAQQTASRTIAISVSLPELPAVNFGALPDSSNPAQQPPVSLNLGSPFPAEITGTLTLSFASSVGGTDDMVRFSNGSRTLNFTIQAGATAAQFAGNPAILTGTVAGTITLTARLAADGNDITPSPAPAKTIAVNSLTPVITSVQVQRSGSTLNVIVNGYTTTREIASGVFRFTSGGSSLAQSEFTVQLSAAFAAWFGNTASNATGGLFRLTVPFSVQGDAAAVNLANVALTNSRGTSAAVGP